MSATQKYEYKVRNEWAKFLDSKNGIDSYKELLKNLDKIREEIYESPRMKIVNDWVGLHVCRITGFSAVVILLWTYFVYLKMPQYFINFLNCIKHSF